MENKKAIVIGAGVSGLSAALKLKSNGFDVTVIEKKPTAGGVIKTISHDGFKAETGSNSVMVNSQKTLNFLNEIGLEQKISNVLPIAKKRYFVRYGKPQAVPMGPLELLKTSLFTFFGKIRLVCEMFVKPTPTDKDMSVADFAKMRLGQEGYDYAINPFMAGIYAGNPEKLSMKHSFPPFWNLAAKYGSIIKGAMKSRKEKMAAGNFFKPIMISFEGGMGTLPDVMAAQLGDSLKTNAKVISIDSSGEEGWQVAWGTDSEDVCENYDALIIAIPAADIKNLPLGGGLTAMLEPLSKIVYAPMGTYTMGFKREDISHPLDGFGVLTPEKENLSILGSLFVSSIFNDRAPQGYVTLTNYIGGMRNPKYTKLSKDEIRELVLADLKKLLGLKGKPVFEELTVWENAISQYNVGYQDFLDIMDKAEDTLPNFALVGAYRKGVGVSNCIENGVITAEKISKKLAKN